MHEVLVNRLGGLSLPRKSVVRLTDRPDMTLDVYRGRKTTIQQSNDYWAESESFAMCTTDVTISATAINNFDSRTIHRRFTQDKQCLGMVFGYKLNLRGL